jgi:hypothetical protein
MIVDCVFPGGNILIDKIEGAHIFVHQDQRDTAEHWFYWYFRLRDAGGKTVVVHFTDWNVIGVRGPAVSLDGGANWFWAGSGCVLEATFEFAVPAGLTEIRFAFTIPYLQSNFDDFLARHPGHPRLEKTTLCRSRKGRSVELLRAGAPDETAPFRLLLTARHHACEAIANYVMEGILETMLSNSAEGTWFQSQLACLAVPFVDKDGVEDGDQGKLRVPRDHNRDYAGESLYPEVRAIRDLIPAWTGKRLNISLDIHCPWIRGDRNEEIFFPGCDDPIIWAEIGQYCDILAQVQHGPLCFARKNNLNFGQEWNVHPPPGNKTADQWCREMGWLGMIIEVPYANAGSQEVNSTSARLFGRDLAHALREFISQK